MKYLILFELGKKHLMEAFTSKNAAIEALNFYTETADSVISSIDDLGEDKYSVSFIDGSQATFKILENANESVLGYYPADLARIFEKLRVILLSRKYNEDKTQINDEIRAKRNKARKIVMIGVAIMLAGFAMAALALSPIGAAWEFAAMGSLILLGLATMTRGSYKIAHPLPKYQMRKLVKA